MKKILLIILIIAVVGGLVWAGYIFSRRPAEQRPASGGSNAFQNLPSGGAEPLDLSSGGGLPAAGGQLSLLSRRPAFAYAITGETSAVLIQPDGQIVGVNGGGSSTLSGGGIKELRQVKFSADNKKVAVSFGELESQLSVFDVEDKTWQPISDAGDAFAWAPSGQTLAYISNGEQKALFSINMAASALRARKILDLQVEDVRLAWVGDFIWMYDKPSAFTNGSLWRIDPALRTLDLAVEEQLGLNVNWGEDLALVFGSNLGQRGGRLSLTDLEGGVVQQLRILTLPEKCAFYEETVVISAAASSTPAEEPETETKNYLLCAVPRDSQELSRRALPDDYYRREALTKDGIYKIDLVSGALEPLWAEDAPSIDAVDLKISGGNLYFLNRWNDGVYKLKL